MSVISLLFLLLFPQDYNVPFLPPVGAPPAGDIWRPVADQLETGAWRDCGDVNIGAGNQCFGHIDEVTADDATTCCKSPGNPTDAHEMQVDFEAIDDPVSGNCTFRTRLAKDQAAGRQINVVVELRLGSDDSVVDSVSWTDKDNTWETKEATFAESAIDAWGTEGDVYVNMDPVFSGGGAGRIMLFTWSELECGL